MGACVNTKAMNDAVSYSTFHSSCFFFASVGVSLANLLAYLSRSMKTVPVP